MDSRDKYLVIGLLACLGSSQANGEAMEPEDTEVWQPVPPMVMAGDAYIEPPSDAIVLFDGTDLSRWRAVDDGPGMWAVQEDHMTVKAGSGDLVTRESFGSIQLYLEWRTPAEIEGDGQGRGNSGIFFQERYEVQVLDSYQNTTYVNGMAGSIYKQAAPLVNAARKPGTWQSYNILFRQPEFAQGGRVVSPARVTVLWNGVLVQDDVELEGPTVFIGRPRYQAHGHAPIRLQDHGDAVSFRNIWVRRLPAMETAETSGVQ